MEKVVLSVRSAACKSKLRPLKVAGLFEELSFWLTQQSGRLVFEACGKIFESLAEIPMQWIGMLPAAWAGCIKMCEQKTPMAIHMLRDTPIYAARLRFIVICWLA